MYTLIYTYNNNDNDNDNNNNNNIIRLHSANTMNYSKTLYIKKKLVNHNKNL